MKTIETPIQINAQPEQVWDILTDLERYPEWNPFIKSAVGSVVEGERLEVRIAPPGKKQMRFKPTVLRAKANAEFSWLGHLWFPGLFDGEHSFTITESEQGTLLVQKEVFSGILVPLVWGGMEQSTKAGFERMNRALKQRAEGTVI